MKTAKEVAQAKKAREAQAASPAPKRGDAELAARLRRMRQDHGLAVNEVAEAIGMSAGNLSNLEAGRSSPSLGGLAKFAAFFECTLDDLAGHLVEAERNGR
jgi:transcriptional regulator with XRE-family HTH domain